MRVGILTLHGAINYGAALQAYGLSRFLTSMGHEVEVIDYFPPEVYSYYDYHIFSDPTSLRGVVSKVLRRRRNEREFKAFEAFRMGRMTLSHHCVSSEELEAVCSSYGAVICGSDQVWNPKANGGLMREYYLGRVPNGIKRVAYAASFGNVGVIEGREDEVATLLRRFDAISVREDEAVGLCERLSGLPVERVIDPSMLLSRADYEKVERPIETPERYLLSYKLGQNDAMTDAVASVSKTLGLPVVSLGRKMSGSTFRKDIGPSEFLRLYAGADCVITNSFHGTAFSLLYGKPFVTFGNGAYNSRMETLLGITGEKTRFCEESVPTESLCELLTMCSKRDFGEVIRPECERARAFLMSALGGAR